MTLPPFSVLGCFYLPAHFAAMISIGLVFSIHDPTEVAIQKMIDASQEIITMGSQGELGGMSPPMKKHLELEIKILKNAPKDADKLRKLLQIRQRQKEEEAMHIEDTQRLVTEIEMLKVVLHLVSRKKKWSQCWRRRSSSHRLMITPVITTVVYAARG
jgi:hypothetical protein